jgi:hypothetical protein
MPAGNHQRPEVATQEAARIMLRPIASSLPLGFFAFGGTMQLTALELLLRLRRDHAAHRAGAGSHLWRARLASTTPAAAVAAAAAAASRCCDKSS